MKKRSRKAVDTSIKTRGGPSVWRYTFLALLLNLGLIGAGAYHHYEQMQAGSALHTRLQGESMAARLAAQLATRLQVYGEFADGIAAQPRLAEALAANEQAVLEEYRALIRMLLPGVLRVRFFPLGGAALDEQDRPAFGYACLDLVHSGESSSAASLPLEAHVIGTEHQHLDLLRTLRTDQGVVGTVLISLDAALPGTWLKALAQPQSYLELRQGGSLAVASQGQAGLKTQSGFQAPVAASRWRLHYWPRAPAAPLLGKEQEMLLLIGAVLAGVLLVMLLMTALLRRRLNKDLVAMVKRVVDELQGKGSAQQPRLRELRRVLASFERRRQQQSAQPRRRPPPPPPPGGAVGGDEELASALFLKDAVKTTEEPSSAPKDGGGLSAAEVAKTLQDMDRDG